MGLSRVMERGGGDGMWDEYNSVLPLKPDDT